MSGGYPPMIKKPVGPENEEFNSLLYIINIVFYSGLKTVGSTLPREGSRIFFRANSLIPNRQLTYYRRKSPSSWSYLRGQPSREEYEPGVVGVGFTWHSTWPL